MLSAIASANGRDCGAGRHDVIDRRKRALRRAHAPSALPQLVKRLRTGHLVDEMQADVELRLAVRQGPHAVEVPDFLEEGSRHGCASILAGCRFWNERHHGCL